MVVRLRGPKWNRAVAGAGSTSFLYPWNGTALIPKELFDVTFGHLNHKFLRCKAISIANVRFGPFPEK